MGHPALGSMKLVCCPVFYYDLGSASIKVASNYTFKKSKGDNSFLPDYLRRQAARVTSFYIYTNDYFIIYQKE